jgi:hypothetical protein
VSTKPIQTAEIARSYISIEKGDRVGLDFGAKGANNGRSDRFALRSVQVLDIPRDVSRERSVSRDFPCLPANRNIYPQTQDLRTDLSEVVPIALRRHFDKAIKSNFGNHLFPENSDDRQVCLLPKVGRSRKKR